MKYSGGSGQGSRQEVEAWERKHAEAQAALERVKTRYLRMTKVFIDIRVGIEHMADKLEPVRLDVPPVPISDETIVDVMQQCDQKLLKMSDVISMMPADEIERPRSAPDALLHEGGVYNVRVALPGEEEEEEEEEEEGLEPEIPDRQMMKKLHGMMLDKANAKGKKKRRKFGSEGGGEKVPAKGGGKTSTTGARSRGLSQADLA